MGTYIITRTDTNKDVLQHHGKKGMKWGQRLYQNKDGSLTPLGRMRYGSGNGDSGSGGKTPKKKVSRKVRKQREAALEKARQAKAEKKEQEKTTAEIRERLLKSTDAKEIYENRHLLTTSELNDRINRIDMEARLGSKIVTEHKKTGIDYVNDKMKTASDTLGNATTLFKKVDDAYSTVTNSAVGKTLAKKLGLEPPKKEFDIDELWKNRNKLSNKEIQDISQRVQNEKSIENELNRRKKNAEKEAAEAKAKKEEKAAKKEEKAAKKEEKAAKKEEKADKKEPETERYEATGDDVFGKGKSTFNGWKKQGEDYVQDGVFRDVKTSDISPSTEVVVSGKNYVSGLLEDKSGR